MDFTSRMVTLLGELRRQRNGAVADAMYAYGAPVGLNYGVSLPTVRRMARAQSPDHDFAAYLYMQDVRELRLAALHLAQPERISAGELDVWSAGVVNSEIAEEAAFALLWRIDSFPCLFDEWTAARNPLLQYAALLAGARAPQLGPAWIAPAMDAVRRAAAAPDLPAPSAVTASSSMTAAPGVSGFCAESAASHSCASSGLPARPTSPATSGSSASSISPAASGLSGLPARSIPAASATPAPSALSVSSTAPRSSDAASLTYPARLVAQGVVALLAACAARNEENRQAVIRAAGSLGSLPAEDFILEELAWRLEA